MSKAQATRQRIIQQAAEIFNQNGYAGTSLSEIMKATGLQKGGIYNHFGSKEELALAAFDFAVEQLQQRYQEALRGKRHAPQRLKAIVEAFCSIIGNPPIKGGCPLLNTAIDSDDTHPILRARTQEAMDRWRGMIVKIVNLGIKKGEIQSSVSADHTATILISVLEGALMMSKLYGDHSHLHRATQHLFGYIDSLES